MNTFLSLSFINKGSNREGEGHCHTKTWVGVTLMLHFPCLLIGQLPSFLLMKIQWALKEAW